MTAHIGLWQAAAKQAAAKAQTVSDAANARINEVRGSVRRPARESVSTVESFASKFLRFAVLQRVP